MTTWRSLIEGAMSAHGEDWEDIVSTSPAGVEWADREFGNGYGGLEGRPFTVWTSRRVYFPACYDGSEWADSVARHPDGVATTHKGDPFQ